LNERLSEDRAAAAAAYFTSVLAARGVTGVTVTSFGSGIGNRPVLVDNQSVTLSCHS
jgi:hypothetical protein